MTTGAHGALVALGGYGLTMVMAGVALVAMPAAGTPTVDLTEGTLGSDVSSFAVDAQRDTAPGSPGDVPVPGPRPTASAPETLPAPSAVPLGIPTARQASAAPGQTVAFVPTRLRLPTGTQAPVISVGVAADGALEIPENPAEVGIWDGGARVGDARGTLVIAGHVDSRKYGLGVLYQLKGVRPGAVIELGDGTNRQRYTVTSSRYVNQQSLATDDQFFRQDVQARLVVITCGGPFDPVRRRYRDNYIVTATPA